VSQEEILISHLRNYVTFDSCVTYSSQQLKKTTKSLIKKFLKHISCHWLPGYSHYVYTGHFYEFILPKFQIENNLTETLLNFTFVTKKKSKQPWKWIRKTLCLYDCCYVDVTSNMNITSSHVCPYRT
jgi:hypothetical protein